MMDEKNGIGPIRLLASSDQTINGLALESGERFESNGAEAVEAVLSGQATLDLKQSRPPTEVLDAVCERVLDVSKFGPTTRNESTINRFEMAVMQGGILKNTAAGRALHWMNGKTELSRKFKEEHSCIKQTSGVVAQLEACREARKTAVTKSFIEREFTEVELIQRGLEFEKPRRVRAVRGASKVPVYYNVGTEWAMFGRTLDLVLNIERHALRLCLEEGRVLAVLAKSGVFTLHPPWSWNESGKLPDLSSDWRFLFSRDLPKTWLPQNARLKGEEREAAIKRTIKVLEKRYLAAAPEHETIKKSQIVNSIVHETGFTKHLVEKAWSLANIPIWKKSGRPKGR